MHKAFVIRSLLRVKGEVMFVLDMPFGTADGFSGIFDIFLFSRSLTQAVEGETSALADEIEPSLLAEIRIYNLNWEKMSRDNIKIRVLTSLMFVGFFHNSFSLSVFLSFSLPLFLSFSFSYLRTRTPLYFSY